MKNCANCITADAIGAFLIAGAMAAISVILLTSVDKELENQLVDILMNVAGG